MTLPWQTLDQQETADGLLELRQRGERDFLITIAGRVLMNSHANRSEIVLAQEACKPLAGHPKPRVLISGLGMGFTLAAALEQLPAQAQVVVAELNPVVVDWCRGPLAPLTGQAIDDPRVRVEIADVAQLISQAAMPSSPLYDAIILDLYEGPYEADHIFGEAALFMAAESLAKDGIYAVWSEDPDRGFEGRLRQAGFRFDTLRPGRGGRRHAVYLARLEKRPPVAKKSASPKKRRGRRRR